MARGIDESEWYFSGYVETRGQCHTVLCGGLDASIYGGDVIRQRFHRKNTESGQYLAAFIYTAQFTGAGTEHPSRGRHPTRRPHVHRPDYFPRDGGMFLIVSPTTPCQQWKVLAKKNCLFLVTMI